MNAETPCRPPWLHAPAHDARPGAVEKWPITLVRHSARPSRLWRQSPAMAQSEAASKLAINPKTAVAALNAK